MSTTNHDEPKPGSPGHTEADHELLKLNVDVWERLPHPRKGSHVEFEAEDGRPLLLEARNCACGSTLLREVRS